MAVEASSAAGITRPWSRVEHRRYHTCINYEPTVRHIRLRIIREAGLPADLDGHVSDSRKLVMRRKILWGFILV